MNILNAWISPDGIVHSIQPGEHVKFAEEKILSERASLSSFSKTFDQELVDRGWKLLCQREGGPFFVLPNCNVRHWPEKQRISYYSLLEKSGIN